MTFFKIDQTAAYDVYRACGAKCIPTFMVFKGGEKVGILEGAYDEKLRELITEHKCWTSDWLRVGNAPATHE